MAEVATKAGPRRNMTIEAFADSCDAPAYDKRLSDKILAAFNHAYAAGALETARYLKFLLVDVERREGGRDGRRGIGAVDRANLWVAYVDARNRYNALCHRKDAVPAHVEMAVASMKDAYRAWSDAA